MKILNCEAKFQLHIKTTEASQRKGRVLKDQLGCCFSKVIAI